MQFYLCFAFLGFYWLGGFRPPLADFSAPSRWLFLSLAVFGAPTVLWGWGVAQRYRADRPTLELRPAVSDRLVILVWTMFAVLGLTVGGWGAQVGHWLEGSVWTAFEFPMLLAPSLLALLGCWWVQAWQATTVRREDSNRWRSAPRQVREFVQLRIQVYLLLSFLPLLCVAVAQTMTQPWAQAVWGTWNAIPGALIVLGLTLAVLPNLIARWWRTTPFPPGPYRAQLDAAARAVGVRFHDLRVWPTGGRIANALVLGSIFPRKLLVLSDGLLGLLDPEQMAAIVAHEAGHVRAWHFARRTLLLAAPLFWVATVEALSPGRFRALLPVAPASSWEPETGLWLAALILYSLYLLIVVGGQSRRMETEADLLAVGQVVASEFVPQRQAISVYSRALLRLAEDAGHDPFRGSWLHPSLGDRIVFLNRVAHQPELARHFFAAQRRWDRWLIGGWLGSAAVLLL